jgi:hypothetical protein
MYFQSKRSCQEIQLGISEILASLALAVHKSYRVSSKCIIKQLNKKLSKKRNRIKELQ